MARRAIVVQCDFRSWARQDAERRSTQIRARLLCRRAVEARREEKLLRIRVKQRLLRVVGVPAPRPGGARSVDAVGVVAWRLCLGPRQPAMPDHPCLVDARIEAVLEQRMSKVVLAEEEHHHALGVLGVEREVVGAILLDPCSAARENRAFF